MSLPIEYTHYDDVNFTPQEKFDQITPETTMMDTFEANKKLIGLEVGTSQISDILNNKKDF